jgi:hypothetical protein
MNHKQAPRNIDPLKVKFFIKIQNVINDQIEKRGQANLRLCNLLELIGDSLNQDEIDAVCLEHTLRQTNQLN